MNNLRIVQGPQSRDLGVAQWGDPDGVPVFVLHGTPGSRFRRPPNEEAVRAAGFRLITYDRPGYGASERQPGRQIVDCVADVVAIADALEVDRFHVTGGSGGGPHALALAARLADRVIAVDCVVSPVPYDIEGFDFFAGMDPENVREFGWALDGEQLLHEELSREAKGFDHDEPDPAGGLEGFELDASDRELLARDDMKQMFHETDQEAFRTGVWGWVDDDLAMITPWGFDVTEIKVPVTVRYGARDVLVPAAHGEWLANHVPAARVVVDHTGGHLVSPEDQLIHLVELTTR